MPKKTPEQLIQEQLPNFRVVRRVDPIVRTDNPGEADIRSRSVSELRKKYVPKVRGIGVDAVESSADRTENEPHLVTYVVEPRNIQSEDQGLGSKTVQVLNGKIVLYQG